MSLLITNPDNIFYLTNFPLHEAPGREVFLILSKKENLFITDGRLVELARKIVPKEFKVVERSHQVTVSDIIKKSKFKTLAYEKSNLTVLELERFTKEIKNITLVGTENVIENLRIIKKDKEIEKIKKAAKITDKAFSQILPYLKPGATESEIVWKIKAIFNSFGGSPAFEPIVASGSGSSIPHYGSTSKKLKKQEIILLDFGAKFQEYCSDMSRVVFLGKTDSKTRNIYNVVLEAQQEALKQKSNRAKNIDAVARNLILKAGFPSIPHGVGHGVGIAIHEAPRLNPKTKDILKTGMVFTIEPGIYLPGWGGIRIEDLVMYGKNGLEILSKTTKKFIELKLL